MPDIDLLPEYLNLKFRRKLPDGLVPSEATGSDSNRNTKSDPWTVQEGNALYNTAYYINKDGSVAGVYRKINLWETEKAKLTPGTTVSVFPTAHGMVGMIICWDISFPALFAEMVNQGVRLVISPTYWSFPRTADSDAAVDDEILLIDSLCTTRAFENNIVFAYCNAGGELKSGELDVVLSGRSQITHPLDKVLCKATSNGEEIVFAAVSIDEDQPST